MDGKLDTSSGGDMVGTTDQHQHPSRQTTHQEPAP
jgi:hypothetical protein